MDSIDSIENEQQYELAMARHLELMFQDPEPASDAFVELEELTELIQKYEALYTEPLT